MFLSSMYMYQGLGNGILEINTMNLELMNYLGFKIHEQCLKIQHMTSLGYLWHYVSRSCGLGNSTLLVEETLNWVLKGSL